jgi:hypothetical protein
VESHTSLSVEPFIIGRQDDYHIEVTATDTVPWITAVSSDPARQNQVDELVRRSGDLVAAGDIGGHVWYTATLVSEPFTLDAFFMSRLQEVLTSRTRILEWRRLGWNILLNFREEVPQGHTAEENPLFPPQAVIDVYIALPGPNHGPLTDPIAHRMLEEIAAICTFALGRAANFPPSIFPATDEAVAEHKLESRRFDTAIGNLAREGVSLDIYNELFERGGIESCNRARAAFLSFDAAIRQQREQVAVIMYVVAAECLTNPYQPWKTERLTTRFIKFFDELMPDDLDQLVQHGNFETAFDILRGERSARALRGELLSNLYNFRSEPVHEGLSASFGGLAAMGNPASQRRALALLLAQKAIIRFLESPRTSLIGHPATAPPPEAKPQPDNGIEPPTATGPTPT